MTKKCNGCLEYKDLNLFSNQKKGKYGVESKCKKCRRLKQAAHEKTIRDRLNEKQRQYGKNNRDKVRVTEKKCYHKNPTNKIERSKIYHKKHRVRDKFTSIQRNHNLSRTEAIKIANKLRGYCEVCQEVSNNLYIDHCHRSGKVRGLLCDKCNKGIGFFMDEIELLKKGIEYLEKYE